MKLSHVIIFVLAIIVVVYVWRDRAKLKSLMGL